MRKHWGMVDQSGDVSKRVLRLRVERKVVDHVLVVFNCQRGQLVYAEGISQ
jgi:hypothetical protein